MPVAAISGDSSIEETEKIEKKIKWIGSFSSSNNFKQESSFANTLTNFLFGREELQMSRPISLVVSPNGVIDILDQGNGALLRVDRKNQEMSAYPTVDNIAFPSLVGICKNGNNEILFTDSKLNKIFIQKSESKSQLSLNDSLILNQPTGIAYNFQTNQIWVVETAAHRIAVLDSKGKLIKYIGSRGTEAGQFNFPTFIWIDTAGTVYVIDSMNFRLQILNSEGDVHSIFGEAGDATGFFARPKGVATDSENNIYIVDALFHTVQIFDQQGHFLHNFGQQGKNNGDFWMPSGIYIDSFDHIYVADSYNARIQIFELSKKGLGGFDGN